jgi:tRNA(Arg) A34 adenosine deaminase TadA
VLARSHVKKAIERAMEAKTAAGASGSGGARTGVSVNERTVSEMREERVKKERMKRHSVIDKQRSADDHLRNRRRPVPNTRALLACAFKFL